MAEGAPFPFSSSVSSPVQRAGLGGCRRLRATDLRTILVTSLALAPLFGCTAGSSLGLQSQMITDLESENVRLQTELTELREAKLQAERNRCSPETSRSAKNVEKDPPLSVTLPAAPGAERPELPVVKMGPQVDPEESPEAQAASIRPAAPAEEVDVPDNTRPVLKVRGQHEAWVYHRPLEESEKRAGSPPVSGSSPSAAGAE